MSKIPESLYKDIIKSVPIICIDLCIACHENGIKNGYLLVKRKQEPLLGDLWVPGGRVFQNETLLDAAQRKLKEEIGITKENTEFFIKGIYEDVFDRSSFEKHTYHTISIVYDIDIETNKEKIKLDNTSKEWVVSKKLPQRLSERITIF